jgi:chromosomal replication initiation ATPase DnaA
MADVVLHSPPFFAQRIMRRAAEMYGLSLSDLCGASRSRTHTAPRFAAAWAMSKFGMSLAEIGRFLGHRDHKTIGNAVARAEQLERRLPGYRAVLEELLDAAAPGASAWLPQLICDERQVA